MRVRRITGAELCRNWLKFAGSQLAAAAEIRHRLGSTCGGVNRTVGGGSDVSIQSSSAVAGARCCKTSLRCLYQAVCSSRFGPPPLALLEAEREIAEEQPVADDVAAQAEGPTPSAKKPTSLFADEDDTLSCSSFMPPHSASDDSRSAHHKVTTKLPLTTSAAEPCLPRDGSARLSILGVHIARASIRLPKHNNTPEVRAPTRRYIT